MRERIISFKKNAANRAIKEAKIMIRAENFKSAITKVQEAINLYTYLPNGQEMLTVCEILHKSQTFQSQPDRETWPYDLLQIPSSSTESQVESRYKKLLDDLVLLKDSKFLLAKRASFAAEFLRETMSAYNRYKLVVLSSDDNDDDDMDDDDDDDDEEDGGDDDDSDEGDGDAAEKEDGDDDLFAVRSPEFKKLWRNIFTASPQQPHFRPLAKYCPSVRQEMRLGFDMIFVKLTQKLQNLGDISNEEEDTIRGELSNLEEMGYDVMKLRERFDLLVRLKTLVKEDESYEEKGKNLEGQISAEIMQLEKVQRKISMLKGEKEVLKAQHHSLKYEIYNLRSKLSKGENSSSFW